MFANLNGGVKMKDKQRTYFCIDMKSFYASVECAERGLNPFETNLVVTDETRGKNAICLAITPKMKAMGIRNRCRLSEIPNNVDYIRAIPRMQLYIEYSADIYGVYLNYFSPMDIHVYSIDESFIDVTDYLKLYKTDAKSLAKKLVDDIARTQNIPATVGIGTNLYLAKIALDITAKHTKDHIGYLDEEIYKATLWKHKPITDFWQVAKGTADRLARYGIYDMEGIAKFPEERLYKVFGINAELLIDHAWGRETCLMEDIKNYNAKSKSISFSQILPCDYSYEQAKIVVEEMILNGCHELMKRGCIAGKIGLYVGYTFGSRESSGKTMSMSVTTNLYSKIKEYALKIFEEIAVRTVPIRKLGINFSDVCDEGCEGYDLFTDFEKVKREKERERTVLDIYDKYGKNALLRGTNYLEGATQRERNGFIGGHRAGFNDKTTKG